MSHPEQQQIDQCLVLLDEVIAQDLLGVYLYGSAVIGGLQKFSDIDLLAVVKQSTTLEQKKQLVTGLLQISGIYMKSSKYPIELTIVVDSAVKPWRYPPQFDFQYGDWLRETFQKGDIEPWQSKEMADLAIIFTKVLLSSKTLLGPAPDQMLPEVPYSDFIKAMMEGLPSLKADLEVDTRNVLLTLARVWCTLETDSIHSKQAAADWVIQRIPSQYQLVLQCAKAFSEGREPENWDDLSPLLKPCVDFMLSKIEEQIVLQRDSGHINKSISIG